LACGLGGVALLCSLAVAETKPNLKTEFASTSLIVNGITTTPDARRFAVVRPQKSGQPHIAEITRVS
jgi:hypothetical protein